MNAPRSQICSIKHIDGRVITGTRNELVRKVGIRHCELSYLFRHHCRQAKGWSLLETVLPPFQLTRGKPCRSFGRLVHDVHGIFIGSSSEFADLYSGTLPRINALVDFWKLINRTQNTAKGWRLLCYAPLQIRDAGGTIVASSEGDCR